MKRILFAALSTLVVISAVAPSAHALKAGTSTCPINGNHCVGAGR